MGLNAGLLLELIHASLQRPRQPEVVEHPRMQPLRPVPDSIQRLLGDAAHLLQLRPERRVGGRMPPRPSQHRANRGEDLPEVVVQLARERALQILLHPHHPLRQCPQLRVQPFDGQERAAVGRHHPSAESRGDDEDHADQEENLASDPIVNRAVGLRGLLLHLIVGDQEL